MSELLTALMIVLWGCPQVTYWRRRRQGGVGLGCSGWAARNPNQILAEMKDIEEIKNNVAVIYKCMA